MRFGATERKRPTSRESHAPGPWSQLPGVSDFVALSHSELTRESGLDRLNRESWAAVSPPRFLLG